MDCIVEVHSECFAELYDLPVSRVVPEASAFVEIPSARLTIHGDVASRSLRVITSDLDVLSSSSSEVT